MTFFIFVAGCKIPALGGETPALHVAEDQVVGQGKSTAIHSR